MTTSMTGDSPLRVLAASARFFFKSIPGRICDAYRSAGSTEKRAKAKTLWMPPSCDATISKVSAQLCWCGGSESPVERRGWIGSWRASFLFLTFCQLMSWITTRWTKTLKVNPRMRSPRTQATQKLLDN